MPMLLLLFCLLALSQAASPANHFVVFGSKPFDFEVDAAVVPNENISAEMLDFNPYFSNLPADVVISFQERYFEMFVRLYPGLRGVPIRPEDVQGLVVLSFFLSECLEVAVKECKSLAELYGPFSLFNIGPEHEELFRTNIGETCNYMLQRAIKLSCYYTVEAYSIYLPFSTDSAALSFSIKYAALSGDYRLVNRFASQVEPSNVRRSIINRWNSKAWPDNESNPTTGSNDQQLEFKTSSSDFNFKILENLGSGMFGACFKIESAVNGRQYALKRIPKRASGFKSCINRHLIKEVLIQQCLSHKNIVKLYNCFEDFGNTYLVMEFCGGKSLGDRLTINRLSFDEFRDLMLQVAVGLQYIHSFGIVHRDIKPDNLLLDSDSTIKICDFGMASIPNPKSLTLCGTPKYNAPEMLKGTKGYGLEVDIWALGVTMFVCLRAGKIFEMDNNGRISINFPCSPAWPSEVENLIRRALEFDPEKRITLEAMCSDPFFIKKSKKQRLS